MIRTRSLAALALVAFSSGCAMTTPEMAVKSNAAANIPGFMKGSIKF